ncbi:Metallo-dependent phosphatase-like protein [Dissophora ornata]|nr:Metallo-dependent phosphatase-like protein [Dissophora ornata]
MLRPVFILALLCLLVIYWRQPSSSSSPSSSSDSSSEDPLSRPKAAQPGHSQKSFSSSRTSQVSKRTVAVGDLHSDLPQTLAVLSLAKVIDADGNWSGGQDTLVQTGDIVDRGPDTIAIYNLFDKLRKQAHDAGGKVVNVYGNHEVMNLGQDLRYVTEEDYASFGGRQKRKEAWDVRTGWLGKMIYNNFNITHVRANTVFSHGDMEPEWARLGVDTLNFLAQEAIWESNYRHAPIFQGTGPIWSRAQATQEDGAKATCERVEEVKKALGVHRLISGHTPQYRTGKILSLCNGGYMVIDVGISNYYGGHLAALEIIENGDGTENVYALYPGGKRLL